ncbi:MAG: hypothetical protein KAS74_08125 [Methanosarcinales archaeon]|nr:hypothetical protein [Methanosarcinales archaeon]
MNTRETNAYNIIAAKRINDVFVFFAVLCIQLTITDTTIFVVSRYE